MNLPKISNPLRVGWCTSEFALSLLVVLVPIFKPETALGKVIALAAAVVGYAVSRGWLKGQAVKAGLAGPPTAVIVANTTSAAP